MIDYAQRIKDLKLKAASKQAAVDLCDGHIWRADYVSVIDSVKGSSSVCVRCGERRGWGDITEDEPRVGS